MKYTLAVVITVLFISCSKEPTLTAITQTSPKASLNVIGQSILADGLAKAEIVFQVDSPKTLQGRSVTFTVSPIGVFSNGTISQTVPLDQKGASRVLVSSKTEGVSYITATIGTITNVASVNFLKVTALDTLVISILRDSITADNYSYAEIKAKTTTPGAILNRQVKFIIDKGTFSNGLKEYDANFGLDSTVRIFVKHSRSEVVRIAATVNGSYRKELALFFTQAYPDQILIEPSTSVLPNALGAQSNVTAKLVRYNGFASENQVVAFYDSTSNGTSIGSFVNTTRSDSSGRATTQYFVQDTSFHGFIYIKAYIQTPAGRISGVNRILKQ